MAAIDDLLLIMSRLRSPDGGCPWDLEQTFQTIAPYTLEEAYEVVDVIEREAYDELSSELGDLLLQVVFHSQIAKEQGMFSFEDVAAGISAKMRRRHPHVFDDEILDDAEAVRRRWQEIKQAEKPAAQSALDGIPKALPGLKSSQKLGQAAAALGFDWPDATGAIEKVREELNELEQAREHGDSEDIREELGDLLFSIVNVCRHHEIDAESALRQANSKFRQRFSIVEEEIRAAATRGDSLTLEQMELAWKRAKSL